MKSAQEKAPPKEHAPAPTRDTAPALAPAPASGGALTPRSLQLLQGAAGNAAVSRLVAQRYTAPVTLPPSQAPGMRRATADIAAKNQKLSEHRPAAAESKSAQDAAKAPPDDKEAQGKTANAEKMNAARPGTFDKAAFVAAVDKAIAEQAPKNLEEADEFGDSGKADNVKGAVDGKVSDGKESSAADIDTATKAEPDTSQAKEKQVTPLSPDQAPANPGAPNAEDVVPEKQPPAVTDFSEGPAEVDKKMADSDVTEQQLAKGNEPDFDAALSEKKKGEEHAAKAPARGKAAEEQKLTDAKAGVAMAGAQAMAAMTKDRAAAGKGVDAGKGETKSADEKKRAEVTAKLQKVFDATKKDVEKTLGDLDGKVDKQFTEGEKKARDAFTADHKRRMKAYKDKRYSGFKGKLRWVKDKFKGLPQEGLDIFKESRKLYVNQLRGVIASIADTIGAELGKAKSRIAQGRKELRAEVDKLPQDLKKYGDEAAKDFADKFSDLRTTVDDKSKELVQTLASKYTEALKSVDEEIKKLQDENKGLIAKAMDAVLGVIKTIMELKNLLMGILAKAASAITKIISDPIGFLGNLVSAVGAGLNLFLSNIVDHLKKGLVAWLLGTSVKAGIEIPSRFDLRGIIQLLASMVGLTWDNIRSRVVRKGIPEEAMSTVESQVPVAKALATEGPAGAAKEIEGQVGDLKTTILDDLKSYLIPTVIVAGITWIVSLLNPASAFVRAVKAIIDIVTFIVTQGAQIAEFVNAVLDAVIAIAGGGAAGVPKMVEAALAASIPLLIGLLASLVGVGGLANKVKSVLQKAARPVNRAVDKIVDKIAKLGRKLWSKVAGKKTEGKDTSKADDEKQDHRRSEDVKEEARRLLVGPTSEPMSRETLLATIDRVYGRLRPRGLKSLKAEPTESQNRTRILAKASPEDDVAEAQIIRTEKDYKEIIRRAVPGSRDIVPFLKAITPSGGQKEVTYKREKISVDMAFFEEAWAKSQPAVDLIKRRFRNAMKAHHEWIPSNFILDVLQQARKAAEEGPKWIDLQHELRSETLHVVFKEFKALIEKDKIRGGREKPYSIPQGHVGAVYYKGEQQTTHEYDFHNDLRDAFTASSSINSAVSKAEGVAKDWIWDGATNMNPEIHPECYNRRSGGDRITKAGQQDNYKKIEDLFKKHQG